MEPEFAESLHGDELDTVENVQLEVEVNKGYKGLVQAGSAYGRLFQLCEAKLFLKTYQFLGEMSVFIIMSSFLLFQVGPPV